MTRKRTGIRPRETAASLLLGCVVALSMPAWACRSAKSRLVGQWRTQGTPERTLDLFQDGTYSLRLSGKGLGFVSDLFGPQKGTWGLAEDRLVLTYKNESGAEHSERWPINEMKDDEVVLAQERWKRVSDRKGEAR